jgi:hypothetical protein
MLKDRLKEPILVFVCTGIILECESINELLINWYEDYKDDLEEKKDITYRGRILKIIYDVVTDNNGEIIEETDFITIRKDLQEQIDTIDEELDGE